MRVNDSGQKNLNCALCTVAGMLGTTARREWQAIQRHAGREFHDAATIFVELAAAMRLIPRVPEISMTASASEARAEARAQVLGMRYWIRHRTGRATTTIGSVDDPLTVQALCAAIMARREHGDLAFPCLVVGDAAAGTEAREMHWILALRRGDRLGFIDHQLDVGGAPRPHPGAPTFQGGQPFRARYRMLAIAQQMKWQPVRPISLQSRGLLGVHRR